MNKRTLFILSVAAVIFAVTLFLGTVLSVLSINQNRRSADRSVEQANAQLFELRATCTRRVDAITADLHAERKEGDEALARAERYKQQLLDHDIKPQE